MPKPKSIRKRPPIQILPTARYLRECFIYRTRTGDLYWRERPRAHFPSEKSWRAFNRLWPGKLAGLVERRYGYRLITINHRLYFAHRIIWKLMTGKDPTDQIDHIDMIRNNNAWDNLREANHTQ
jgi:hypothetical protein